MLEEINNILIIVAAIYIVISIFIKLRYSLPIYFALHIAFIVIMLGSGQGGGWFVLIYIGDYLAPSLVVFCQIMGIQAIKIMWQDSKPNET